MFLENDIVLLLKKRDPSSSPILTKSLSDTGKEKWEIGRRTDSIPQSEIIGKKIRDVVRSKRGEEYRIHKPTLGEYVALCPRIVTPVSRPEYLSRSMANLVDLPCRCQSDSVSVGPQPPSIRRGVS